MASIEANVTEIGDGLMSAGAEVTAEVAILNSMAVVLAADSATTVTHWVNGEEQKRYFKGSNKLFQLSEEHPVGLMIYGSASLQDVPWEIVIKEFRANKGGASYDKVAGYAEAFFDFVRSNHALFPETERKAFFKETIEQHARIAMYKALQNSASETARADVEAAAKEELEYLRALPVPEQFTQADIDAAIAGYRDAAAESLAERKTFGSDEPLGDSLAKSFTEISILKLIKTFETSNAGCTGIVVAGYGEQEYFPALEVFETYGFVADVLLCVRKESSTSIGPRSAAVMEPFATTGMINTLRLGISPDILEVINSTIKETLKKFGKDPRMTVQGGDDELEKFVDSSAHEYMRELFGHFGDHHFRPLNRVLASLPVNDMAALAQSLIDLQSLKERVTLNSESVSGPIDVAAISKHDGFVWIERKHYFSPELNPRFLRRLQER